MGVCYSRTHSESGRRESQEKRLKEHDGGDLRKEECECEGDLLNAKLATPNVIRGEGGRQEGVLPPPPPPFSSSSSSSVPRVPPPPCSPPARNRTKGSPFFPSPFRISSPFRAQSPSPGNVTNANTMTPRRFFKLPFPPPSPAKHIQAALRRRHGRVIIKPNPNDGGGGGGGMPTTTVASSSSSSFWEAAATPEEGHSYTEMVDLNKTFGYGKNFGVKYEVGEEIGRGHFGHTCHGKVRKGDLKDQPVAVKVISKAKMTTTIAIEDVKREVKILRALTGHQNLVKFYDACEDDSNVYIVMELCEGGELLDRILSRGGRYAEDDAKVVVAQILNIVAFCHLQGVVHRDLKPENFLFTTKDEASPLKAIDFGLSDYARPDERLNDIVGSAYYVAPEVLHRSYSIEADVWSIGVISYILLCGSRPFWARTESGIFRSVLKTEPSFDETPWPIISPEAKDFVKRLLTKDRHKRMTAAQALTHPWLRGHQKIPLDILIFRLIKTYLRSSIVRRAALKAFSKTLSEDDLFYLRAQFVLLEPSKNGRISLESLKVALTKNASEAMKDSRILDMISSIDAAQFKKMDFQEFCAAAISASQYEGLERWEYQTHTAYEIFEREGNRVVMIEDLAKELGVPPTVPAHVALRDWVRHGDGKLSFFGFTNLLRGMPPRK